MTTDTRGWTKGPWKVEVCHSDRGGWDADKQFVTIIGPDDILVANYDTYACEYPDDEVNAANAHLIAAAPAMYEELEAALAMLRELYDDQDGDGDPLQSIVDVLSTARGETHASH